MEELYCSKTREESEHDYRAYDRIWQRVAPDLDPYPEVRAAGEDNDGGDHGVLSLPGAEQDPCCMGSRARSDIQVIRGFVEEEEKNVQIFCRLSRSVQDRQAAMMLRKIGEHAAEHLRQLRSAWYLITGECAPRGEPLLQMTAEGYCAALRRAYHEKACNGFNYLRAADAAADLCLQKLFRDFAAEEMMHAEWLLKLLGRRM